VLVALWFAAVVGLAGSPTLSGSAAHASTTNAVCASSVGPGIAPPSAVPAGTPGFHAAWYGQSGYPTLCPGQRATAVVAYYNSGSLGWVAGRMGEVAYLGTWDDDPGQDQPSLLGGDGQLESPDTAWPRYNRVAVQPAEYVGPGQIAWFQFVIEAPLRAGYYRLHIRPLIEGTAWMEDVGVYWFVTVLNADGTLPPVFANPVIDRDFPDPDVLRVGDVFYAYATNSAGVNVQTARSRDLVHWESLGDAMPSLPPWAREGRTWAPDVAAVPGGFVLYFTAWHAASGRQCIGVAAATAPEGPFRPQAAPLICPLAAGGAIDPGSFVDIDGARYLVWKNDGNCCGVATVIYVQRLSGDGLALASAPTALLTADRDWEGGIVEAPTLWRENGRYHLFYSANGYGGGGYAMGHAVADSLFGPFRKDVDPWMRSGPSVVGPGGQDLVRAGDGATWLVYHTWSQTAPYREMDLGRLTWDGTRPILSPTRGLQSAP
jgi:GH43 family beta-xylosidase